jgi:hypothetical protein
VTTRERAVANDYRVDSEDQEFGRKNLKLITEVALSTMSSSGLKVAFEEYRDKPTEGLFYTLSYCTFPLMEDVMRAIIEVAVDGPEELPKGLYSAKSHDLRWLRKKMRDPSVFEAPAYERFMADVNRHARENRPSHLPLARVQRDHPLLSGRSVFDNIIAEASRVWPAGKYLEEGERRPPDPDLLPLAFDMTRWLLIEFLRYERAHARVAPTFPEMEQYMQDLLHVYD